MKDFGHHKTSSTLENRSETTLTSNTENTSFLLGKQYFEQKVTNCPTTPFGEVEEVEKWLFCEGIALIKWLFCEGKSYLSKRETRNDFFDVF